MRLYKYIGVIAIVLFSFYYTERIASFVLESNDLYKTIEKEKKNYEIKSVSAEINGDYMTPGLNGVAVKVKDSYFNMKSMDVFNSYYLKYESTYPEVSMYQNKDKIINKGNEGKNSVSLVLEYDENIIRKLSGYSFSVLVSMENFQKNASYEQINHDVSNFEKMESLINKYGTNVGICVVNNGNKEVCFRNHKFLVEPTKSFSDGTVLQLRESILPGDIILIKKNTKLENVDLLLKSIQYKDYAILTLSEHISEERVGSK